MAAERTKGTTGVQGPVLGRREQHQLLSVLLHLRGGPAGAILTAKARQNPPVSLALGTGTGEMTAAAKSGTISKMNASEGVPKLHINPARGQCPAKPCAHTPGEDCTVQ